MSDKIKLPQNGKVKEITLSMPGFLGALRQIILVFDGVAPGINTIKLIWINPETGRTATDIYKFQREGKKL